MASIKHNEVEVPLPTGWEDGTQLIALGPLDPVFRTNLTLSREVLKGTETFEKFLERQAFALRGNLPDFKQVKQAEAAFGKHEGVLREYTFSLNGHAMTQLQWYVPTKVGIHVMTFTDLTSRFMTASRKLAEQFFAAVKL